MLRVNGSKGGGVALHKDSIDEGYRAAALGRLDGLARRIFDLLAATMCLILFAPILLLTSIAIKLIPSRPNIYPRDAVRIQEPSDSHQ